jgi:protein ImuA
MPAPETLHPQLWRAHQLGRGGEHVSPSGFPALDAQLPGGGWPRRAITELLLAQPGIGEIRLLASALAGVQQGGRLVMFFDPPAQVSAPALAELGLQVEQLLVVQTHLQPRPGTDRLWALEQVLKSGHVGAVVAWLPPCLRAERVRRLQLAAHVHDGPAFVFREPAVENQPSAAPLRLALRPAGADQLAVRVLKRRGPALLAPLHLALRPVLSEMAALRARLGDDTADELLPLTAASFVNLA